MIPTNNVTPTGGTPDDQKDVARTATTQRTTAGVTDQNKKGKPFREVLDAKATKEKEEEVTALSDEDEEGEVLSPFDLAGQIPIQKVRKTATTLDMAGGDDVETPPTFPETKVPTTAGTVVAANVVPEEAPIILTDANGQPIPQTAGKPTTTAPVATPVVIQGKPLPVAGNKPITEEPTLPPTTTDVSPKKPVTESLTATPKQAAPLGTTGEVEEPVIDPDKAAGKPIVAFGKAPDKDVEEAVRQFIPTVVEKAPQGTVPAGQRTTGKEPIPTYAKVADTEGDVPEAPTTAAPTPFTPVTQKQTGGNTTAKGDEEFAGTTVLPLKEKEVVKDKVKDSEITPQINLAAGAPPTVITPVAVTATQQANEPAKAREILIKLAAQMIEKLEKITSPEKTDTTLTLQYPPLFEGAKIVITEYTTSQKQFNISFSNLSPDAQLLIAMPRNQENLRNALIERGYTLQQIRVEQSITGLDSLESGDVSADTRRALDEQQELTADEGDQQPLA